MEQATEVSTTVKPPPPNSTNEPAWLATYLSDDGRALPTVRLTAALVAEHGDVSHALLALAPEGSHDVSHVLCSSCERKYLAFRVPHDPRACAATHDENLGAYGPMREHARGVRRGRGVPKALPVRTTKRARAAVRRKYGIGVA